MLAVPARQEPGSQIILIWKGHIIFVHAGSTLVANRVKGKGRSSMAPKAVAFDTAKWLKEDLGFTDEQVKVLLPAMDPVKEKIANGYLRQADYGRQMNDLKGLQDSLKAKDDQITREMAEWASMQAGDETKATELRSQLEKANLERFQLEQQIRRVADEHGLDVAKLLPTNPNPPNPGTPGAPGTPGVPQALDPNKFVPREQFASVMSYMLDVPAELAAIGQEHHALTGEYLDTRPLIAELKDRVAKKQPADLRVIWEEKHGIKEKREAQATAKHTEEIKAAEERGRQAARSEAMLPNQHPTGHSSPVFTKLTGPDHGSKLQRPQAGQATRQIAESLRSRKYASGPPAGGHK